MWSNCGGCVAKSEAKGFVKKIGFHSISAAAVTLLCLNQHSVRISGYVG